MAGSRCAGSSAAECSSRWPNPIGPGMRERLLEILACPECRESLSCQRGAVAADGDIVTGELRCARCVARYPISNGIPRFVPGENYAASFGYQWNRFRREQIDSLQ